MNSSFRSCLTVAERSQRGLEPDRWAGTLVMLCPARVTLLVASDISTLLCTQSTCPFAAGQKVAGATGCVPSTVSIFTFRLVDSKSLRPLKPEMVSFTIGVERIVRASLVAQTVKNACNAGDLGFNAWVRKMPWRRKWQPTPELLPGEFHGQRSLSGLQFMGS